MDELKGALETEDLGVLAVASGITEEQINQLIDYSNNDKAVIENTSDKKRFKDRNAYNEWLKKGRKIFTLIDKDRNLLGIVWYGKEDMPQEVQYLEGIDTSQYNYTFAIRLYEKVRGKRLAERFMQKTFDLLKKSSPPDFKGLWLETSTGNTSAVRAYKSFGYKEASAPSGEGRILMVKPVGTEGFGPPTSSM